MDTVILIGFLVLPFLIFTIALSWAVHQTNVAIREKQAAARQRKPISGPDPHQDRLAA